MLRDSGREQKKTTDGVLYKGSSTKMLSAVRDLWFIGNTDEDEKHAQRSWIGENISVFMS